jgi:hypothetical protein
MPTLREIAKAKLINQAKRCQLICGSFDGNLWVCLCPGPESCPLTAEQRTALSQEDEVQQRIKENKFQYAEMMNDRTDS